MSNYYEHLGRPGFYVRLIGENMKNTNGDLNKLLFFLRLLEEGENFDKAFSEVYGDDPEDEKSKRQSQ